MIPIIAAVTTTALTPLDHLFALVILDTFLTSTESPVKVLTGAGPTGNFVQSPIHYFMSPLEFIRFFYNLFPPPLPPEKKILSMEERRRGGGGGGSLIYFRSSSIPPKCVAPYFPSAWKKERSSREMDLITRQKS